MMSWFRLDDSGWCHAKVLLVGNRAFGAWCRAGQWASQQLSDGFVPASVCRLIEPASAVWRALSDAGMIHPCEGGWTIHDYLEYNPSREQVQAKQAAQREGGKAGANARWSRSSHGSTHGSTQDEPMTNRIARARVSSHPIPSHPDPEERQEAPPGGADADAPPAAEPGVKKPRKAKPVNETSPEHARVVAAWFASFEKARGAKPPFNGKDGRAVGTLLQTFRGDVDAITRLFETAFADRRWAAQRATLMDLASNPNQFVGEAAPALPFGRASPPQPPKGAGQKWVSFTEKDFES